MDIKELEEIQRVLSEARVRPEAVEAMESLLRDYLRLRSEVMGLRAASKNGLLLLSCGREIVPYHNVKFFSGIVQRLTDRPGPEGCFPKELIGTEQVFLTCGGHEDFYEAMVCAETDKDKVAAMIEHQKRTSLGCIESRYALMRTVADELEEVLL